MRSILAAIMALGLAASARADEPSACAGPNIALLVKNIRDQKGVVRVQVYGSDPDRFLAEGGTIDRVEVPSQPGETTICVPITKPGTYALTVIHDRDHDGKPDRLSEGFGFSNNPRLLFSPPRHDEARFEAPPEGTRLEIRLRYAF